MTKEKPPAPPPPTAEQQAAAFRFLLIGAGIGVALVFAVGGILDADSRTTFLWQKGRYAGVGLLAWMGYLIGIGRGRVVAENIECLAIAVVMALVLKHFLIEAYKIPTGSMQPTILGNEDRQIFDRVLVNKYSYLIDEPCRYDVIVFKYPLDRSKNYIKRLIGLPGEKLMIFNGDIHVAPKRADGSYGPMRIARKPRSVRDSVLKTIYPSGKAGESFDSRFQVVRGDRKIDGDTVLVTANTMIRYGHGESIRDAYLDGYDPDWGIPAPIHLPEMGTENVSDLAFRCEATPDDGARELRIVLFASGIEHRAILPVGTGETRIESGFRTGDGEPLTAVVGDSPVVASAQFALDPGKATEVAFYHVDQELSIEIDGEPLLSFAYEIDSSDGGDDPTPLYPEPRTSENAVEFGVVGGGATLEEIEVHRDIHYLVTTNNRRQYFEVPDDALLALGDNTQNSSDGRMWSAQEATFSDGTKVMRERNDRTNNPREFIDVYGETYRTPVGPAPVIQPLRDERFRFVPRELLLGKAIAVFWPIFPHFRWKLIR